MTTINDEESVAAYVARNAANAYRLAHLGSVYHGAGFDSPEDVGHAVRDLLTDLRHLCDVAGLDFGDIDTSAYTVYAQERGDARRADRSFDFDEVAAHAGELVAPIKAAVCLSGNDGFTLMATAPIDLQVLITDRNHQGNRLTAVVSPEGEVNALIDSYPVRA